MLASEVFRNSRQADRLLRYLVTNTLEEQDDLLRERAIGVNLYGREPRYDTNEDSIVRVCVNELRKRLAKYYSRPEVQPDIRFAIPLGSYRVEFQDVAPAAEAPSPTPPGRENKLALRDRWAKLSLSGVALLAVASVLIWMAWPKTALEEFWGPAWADQNPVIILAPNPVVYNFTRDAHRRLRGQDTSHAQWQMEALAPPPDTVLHWTDVVPIRDQYVGQGSAHAIADVCATFARHNRRSEIRFGGASSFQDLLHSPAVLVGAYANRWTLQLTDELRFVVAERGQVQEVRDRVTGKIWTLNGLQPDGRTPEDFAIVSRLYHPKTGKLMIALAGVTQYGTQAAGEFVTDQARLEEVMRAAPRGWGRKNLQLVLRVPVVERVPGRAEVVANHYW